MLCVQTDKPTNKPKQKQKNKNSIKDVLLCIQLACCNTIMLLIRSDSRSHSSISMDVEIAVLHVSYVSNSSTKTF